MSPASTARLNSSILLPQNISITPYTDHNVPVARRPRRPPARPSTEPESANHEELKKRGGGGCAAPFCLAGATLGVPKPSLRPIRANILMATPGEVKEALVVVATDFGTSQSGCRVAPAYWLLACDATPHHLHRQCTVTFVRDWILSPTQCRAHASFAVLVSQGLTH